MKKRIFGLAMLVSMCVFPGTWFENFGMNVFRHGTDLIKNVLLS